MKTIISPSKILVGLRFVRNCIDCNKNVIEGTLRCKNCSSKLKKKKTYSGRAFNS